jgi:hypothetical protein
LVGSLCPLVAFGFIVKHRRYGGGGWLDAVVEMKWWIIGTILVVVIAAFWPDGKS